MAKVGEKTQSQIKSKQRVSDHGEVYTPHNIVCDMLDLVKNESERIDSRFLEPACGNGNFLIEILRRKLNVVKQSYRRNQDDYERYSIIAVCSCYGVDILEDNCIECRERLLDLFVSEYKSIYKKRIKTQTIKTIEYVLSKNIICGNALDLLDNFGLPIVFCEWSAVSPTKIKRRDFTFSNLLETENYYQKTKNNSFLSQEDKKVDLIIPKAVRDFPPVRLNELVGMEKKT